MLYMNIEDYVHYQNCENTYFGYLKHYDAMSNLILQNQDTEMEQINITVLASFLDAKTKMGTFLWDFFPTNDADCYQSSYYQRTAK